MPDPLDIAIRYGLPSGIALGLAYALWRVVTTWVQPHVYARECERGDKLAEAVTSLVADVQTLLALQQQRGGA